MVKVMVMSLVWLFFFFESCSFSPKSPKNLPVQGAFLLGVLLNLRIFRRRHTCLSLHEFSSVYSERDKEQTTLWELQCSHLAQKSWENAIYISFVSRDICIKVDSQTREPVSDHVENISHLHPLNALGWNNTGHLPVCGVSRENRP